MQKIDIFPTEHAFLNNTGLMSNRVTMVQTGKNSPRNFLDEIPNNTRWPPKKVSHYQFFKKLY